MARRAAAIGLVLLLALAGLAAAADDSGYAYDSYYDETDPAAADDRG